MKLEQFAISLDEFLINYLNLDYLDSETLEKLRHASHRDLTELGIENIKRIPFECVQVDDILRGDVLIVRSGTKKGDIAPYLRPRTLDLKRK